MHPESVTVFTVGHSNRALEAFIGMLRAHDVARVVDVRAFPGSRKWPWFSRDTLPRALADAGIGYTHAPVLGGRRRASGSGENAGWENESFRAYADHARSAAFRDALHALVSDARLERVSLMCSEAVWWRCHRRLVADALVALGHRVLHIMGDVNVQEHTLTPFARIGEDGTLTYPDPQQRLF